MEGIAYCLNDVKHIHGGVFWPMTATFESCYNSIYSKKGWPNPGEYSTPCLGQSPVGVATGLNQPDSF